jgi:anti-sigma factor RsiW
MTGVVCASGVALLMDFIEGVLPADVNAALEAHVAGCARCAAFVASYEATAVDLPADIEASLTAFLRERTNSFG